MKKSEVLKKVSEKAMDFNEYVDVQAIEILRDVKKCSNTYGEVKAILRECKLTLEWSNKDSTYHQVIDRAIFLLEREIDAITHK